MNFHKRVFIGALFQILDINIGTFDILPDFVGFLIVAYAFSKMNFPYASAGTIFSISLAALSVISIFRPFNMNLVMNPSYDLNMQLVSVAFGMLNIGYFACVFAVSKEIVRGDSSRFPQLFIGFELFAQLWTSLVIHVLGNVLLASGMFILMLSIILHIYFFIYIWKRKKLEDELHIRSLSTSQISNDKSELIF